ncbi:hypothetical protein XENTR_v10016308 [Xenopus tropicalis]|nr:hypothetical protein XENTR_v10016308 [Xenopus tropicalis]|eukprot:XP_002941677.1 PREDICTED: magainins-like [Xenopus tropicalis]
MNKGLFLGVLLAVFCAIALAQPEASSDAEIEDREARGLKEVAHSAKKFAKGFISGLTGSKREAMLRSAELEDERR